MTVTEAPAHRVIRAGGRPRASRPPFVPAVGSPYDEWSTTVLPVVVPASLDAVTDFFPVVAPVVAPVAAPVVVPGASTSARRAVRSVAVEPVPSPRAVHVPAPRAGAQDASARRPVGC